MSVHAAIRRALRARLRTAFAAASLDPATQLALENRDFTAPAPTDAATMQAVPWVRENYLPAGQSLASVPAAGGLVRYEGEYSVTVFAAKHRGTAQADALADAVLRAFPPGDAAIASDGFDTGTVRFRRAVQLPAIPDAAWYQIPVRVRWTADFLNTLTAA